MNIEKCRLCLENNELLINLFEGSDSIRLSSKVMKLTNVKVYANDGLPASICTKCKQKLDECIEFVNMCIKSDNNLRNIYRYSTKNKENNTILDDNLNGVNQNNEITSNIIESEKELTETEENNDKISLEGCNGNVYKQSLSKKQQCFTCGKVMSSKFRLKTHLATHLKEKQHSCIYCKKKFTIIENLNTHLRIHTGEKPYLCPTCGEAFAQSSGLIVHKRKHSGQMPYQCVLCPRSFQTIGNYKYHVRVHTGERNYDCNICGCAFITSGDLKQHKTVHNGEKPYICCVCGIRFSRASNLKRHVSYIHNKEKFFKCQHCSLKFVRKIELTKHELSHENKQNN